MTSTTDHARLLAAAAKAALRPIGCVQKGRSRTWLDDHGWWVGVVEFQPHAWARGSFLNVGAAWLWYEQDFWSFDDGAGANGCRIEPFHEYRSDQQFDAVAAILAARAKDEVLRLRERHASIATTSQYLKTQREFTVRQNYHAGVASGLVGDVAVSRERLQAVEEEPAPYEWVMRLQQQARHLSGLVEDTRSFRAEVDAIVGRTRELRKLPEVEPQFPNDP